MKEEKPKKTKITSSLLTKLGFEEIKCALTSAYCYEIIDTKECIKIGFYVHKEPHKQFKNREWNLIVYDYRIDEYVYSIIGSAIIENTTQANTLFELVNIKYRF